MTDNDLGDSEEIDVFLGQKVSNPETLSKKNINSTGCFLDTVTVARKCLISRHDKRQFSSS